MMASTSEFSLSFETVPPTAVRPGAPFTIPVIISVRPTGTPARNVQHLVVNASLRNEAGTGAAVGLSGNLTASVRSRTDTAMSGYAKFSPLTITRPGKYRLRVMLSAASYNGVVTKECVDSRVIHVHAAAPASQRPSESFVLLILVFAFLSPRIRGSSAWRGIGLLTTLQGP